jgi:hypothetical protein
MESFCLFSYDKNHINVPSQSFLSAQFSDVKYIHIVVQPITCTSLCKTELLEFKRLSH